MYINIQSSESEAWLRGVGQTALQSTLHLNIKYEIFFRIICSSAKESEVSNNDLFACTGGQRKIQAPSNLQERGGMSGLCVQVHEAADWAQPGVGQAGDRHI